MSCKIGKVSPGEQRTGICIETEALCEELADDPFLVNLGKGFEAGAWEVSMTGIFNKDIFIDD